jgi:hypothetical protein
MKTYLKQSQFGILALSVFLLFSATAFAAEENSSDEWEYDFEVYGWLPTIKPTVPNGETLNWSLSDLLSNLDMMAMFNGGARKDKWSFAFDFLYMNLGDTRTISKEIINHPVDVEADLDLRALTFTVFAGYQIAESERNRTDIIGGARYIYIRIPLELSAGDKIEKDLLGGVITWDGIVGLRGKSMINDQWYFDYYGDIGTGQSKLTWQAKAGFGYHFNKWTATFGYRYLRWNYESRLLKDLTIVGPYVGAKWTW